MGKITVLFLDVENKAKEFKKLEIEDELKSYQETLRVDCIDIVRRKIGAREYCIVVDDEGLLKQRPICSSEDFRGLPALFGNLIITGLHTRAGELTSLSDEDIENIKKHLLTRFSLWLKGEYKRLRLSI